MRIVNEGKPDERYVAEGKGNKVFAVDAYVSLAKCIKVEAADAEEAERKVREQIEKSLTGVPPCEMGRVLTSLGFEDCEELETRVSGETDAKGELSYY